jgi:hypothetical protein
MTDACREEPTHELGLRAWPSSSPLFLVKPMMRVRPSPERDSALAGGEVSCETFEIKMCLLLHINE